MDTPRDLIELLLGLSARSQELTLLQVCLRALTVYLAMILFVRFGKKRFLGRATAFDAILVIIIGSTAARAITGEAPFFETLAAVVVLIALHWLISLVTETSPKIGALVKGHSTVLIRNGRIDRKALKQAHMSIDDLDEDLRQAGIDNASNVKEAQLERSGKLSVIRKKN
jgi:uncharacterized membrane protein YcaP (DUF421 family)